MADQRQSLDVPVWAQSGEEGGEPGEPDYVEALRYGMPPAGGVGRWPSRRERARPAFASSRR